MILVTAIDYAIRRYALYFLLESDPQSSSLDDDELGKPRSAGDLAVCFRGGRILRGGI